MPIQFIKVFLISAMLFIQADSYAWGRKGHHIIVELAFARLNTNTREEVLKYLGGLSIQAASTWMDDIRNVPVYKNLETAHYINIPDPNKIFVLPPNDVKRELNKTLGDLRNKKNLNDSLIKLSILKLIHLIGDVHQPLHTGYEVDRGGNDELVYFENKKSNLHRVWDTQLIDKLSIDNSIVDKHIASLSNKQRRNYTEIDVDLWIKESQSYLGQLYAIENKIIDDPYAVSARPIIEIQLARAALRLQRVLEVFFG